MCTVKKKETQGCVHYLHYYLYHEFNSSFLNTLPEKVCTDQFLYLGLNIFRNSNHLIKLSYVQQVIKLSNRKLIGNWISIQASPNCLSSGRKYLKSSVE